ncbi:MAG: hypothetical protein EU548_04850 [Promethearchaeota archaeon]|nr:MAG: hypothetical protein EU548_04850 [Candidatus Lokiarchaeota archaeon]
MTDLKNFRWSPICTSCVDCCINFEYDNDPWNLGVERLDQDGNEISGEQFIDYLRKVGGEASKRIDNLRIDEYGCIEVLMPSDKTYRDLTNCIFLDENYRCIIHPTRINLSFDLRGKLCATYLCEIAEFVNEEMPFLINFIDEIKDAHKRSYGEKKELNLIQYLKKIPKSNLKKQISKILNINNSDE